jgi:hypothetical protein
METPADGPDQGALFQIEGPDEDGCVWICSAEGRDVWCQNLGPRDKVAEVLSQWLASIDDAERSFGLTQDE